MKSINEFAAYKLQNKPIALVTCYDYWSAQIINETNIDAVLVGDSAAMVMHGYQTTVNADVKMLSYHIASVRKGIKNKIIIADMPFLAHRKSKKQTMNNVENFIKLGANAIKIEGANDNLEIISYIVKSGVPVMGHIGFTPQSINAIGGNLVQGKDESTAQKLIDDAKALEDAGCFSIVLELVPAILSKEITDKLNIPTIGIGAGPFTSGQVLVLHDLLGLTKDFNPKFVRKYLYGFDIIKDALNNYTQDVREKLFPSEQESF